MTGHDAETVLRPTPGEGLLACAGDLILLCRPTPEDEAQQLLGLLEGVAEEGGNGWNLVKRLTRAVHGMTDPPALVAYGPTEEGQAVLVHGLATALVRTAEGEVRLDGAEAVTWADRVLHGVVAITASLGANPPGAVSTSVRLDDGVVPAGGFALTDDDSSAPMAALPEPAEPSATPGQPAAGQPAAATGQPAAATGQQPAAGQHAPAAASHQPAAATGQQPPAPAELAGEQQYGADGSVLIPGRAAPPPPPEPAQPEEPGAAGELPYVPAIPAVEEPAAPPLPEEPAAAPPPLGDVPEQPAADQGEAASPEVLGIYCKNDHFNDPEALYCGVCGISMAQQTHVAQPGKRPPLGVLVLDDGETFQLDTTYVIGREPEPHQDVQRGHASAVRIQDPDALVSRAHAMVTLDGWNVQLVDLGSANGTFVLAQGATEWTQLHPHYRTTITPGSRIAIGRRGFLFESHRKF